MPISPVVPGRGLLNYYFDDFFPGFERLSTLGTVFMMAVMDQVNQFAPGNLFAKQNLQPRINPFSRPFMAIFGLTNK